MKYFKETTDRWYKEQPEWGTDASTKKAKDATPNEVDEGKWFVRQSAKPNRTGTFQGKKFDDGKKAIAQARKDWKLDPDEHMSAKMMKEDDSCCEECKDAFDHVISEAEYQGKNVELNNPFRLPSGSNKKFGVYVKNDKGNIVKVTFGDPNMSIKRDSPERRKSFRARHNCADPGPKWKARYWSCYQWRASAKVDEEAPTNSTGPATATDKPVVRKKRFADFVRRDGKVS